MRAFNFVAKTSLGVLLCCFANSASAHEKAVDDNYGEVSFEISCSQDTQAAFNQAVAQLHNMMYMQAEQMFNEAADAEPACAMLYWGIAMTNFHPLWPGGQNSQELDKGAAAVSIAKDLGGSTPREAAYINAVAAMYEADLPYQSRKQNWAKLQHAVYQDNPDDVDAKALYTLSLLAVAPKGDKTLANQKKAGLLLEELQAGNPLHPAGFHYLIHAYDNPLLASKAESVSRAYDKLAPTVPHALHMPSHIFVRMGLWDETIFWNDRSAKAALDQAEPDLTSSHYAHAIDYKVYAHLQRGEAEMATDDLLQANAVSNHQSSFASAYGLAASAARIPLETEDWAAAVQLPVRDNQSIDWDKFPAAVAITHFAKGIGAARSDDLESADASIANLNALLEQLQKDGPAYWTTIVNSQLKSVSAWLAYASDDKDTAIELMHSAAEIEDSVDKSPVTPGAVLPARELYGDMLSLLGRNDDALEAYELALHVSPNRRRSMLGAMHAAVAIGDAEKAKLYNQ